MHQKLVIHQESDDIDRGLDALDGFWKFWSYVFLTSLNYPTLKGFVLLERGPQSPEEVRSWATANGWSELLIRHDRRDENPTYERGGFLCSLDDIENILTEFMVGGRIVGFLEPYSPFNDYYSFNCLLRQSGMATMELVGPGFDASDLKRGDFTPHESIRLDIRRPQPNEEITEIVEERNVLVDDEEFLDSRERRLEKIRDQLHRRGPSSLRTQLTGPGWKVQLSEYLEATNQNRLLESPRSYQPIPESRLVELLEYIVRIPKDLDGVQPVDSDVVVSGSWVGEDPKLVFWDIVWPSLKYQTVSS